MPQVSDFGQVEQNATPIGTRPGIRKRNWRFGTMVQKM